jgi:hypothetical protein
MGSPPSFELSRRPRDSASVPSFTARRCKDQQNFQALQIFRIAKAADKNAFDAL